MMQNELNNANVSASKNTLVTQVSNDLSTLLSASKDRKKSLKKLSVKINVHEKTLERILNLQNRPSYSTVFKIYRYILNENDDSKVIEHTPNVVKDYLLSANPQRLEKGVQYLPTVDKEIQKNPIFAKLYVLAGTAPLKESDVVKQFGTHGLEILESMNDRNILTEKKPGEYILGPQQASLSPESILALGLNMTESYANPRHGQEKKLHFMGFLAEGLTDDAYQAWLKIDEEAYNQKLALTRDPKNLGTKRAFGFTIIETLEPKEKQ